MPISRLADCVLETQADLEDSLLMAPIVGHVGDGNFHLVLLVHRDDPSEIEEAARIHERLVRRALAMVDSRLVETVVAEEDVKSMRGMAEDSEGPAELRLC